MIGVIGSSGIIGHEIIATLENAGEAYCRGLRCDDPAGYNVTTTPGFDAFVNQVDIVIDAGPSEDASPLAQALLARDLPVVSVGHAHVSGTATHIRCAGALPGILAGVPLLLDGASHCESITLLAGKLSRSAAMDIIVGSRKGRVPIRREVSLPGTDLVVDMVNYADADTEAVDQLLGEPVQWWNAWAGTRFREALFTAAGTDLDTAVDLLVATAATSKYDNEVTVSATSSTDRIHLTAPSIARVCAEMAVYCARTVRVTPLVTSELTGLQLLLPQGARAVTEIITAAGGQVSHGEMEEDEL